VPKGFQRREGFFDERLAWIGPDRTNRCRITCPSLFDDCQKPAKGEK